jgi:hypothetical protein
MLWVTCHPLSPLSPLWRCGHVPVPSTPSLPLRGETVTTGGPWNLYTAEGAWTRLTCGGCPSEANVKYGCFLPGVVVSHPVQCLTGRFFVIAISLSAARACTPYSLRQLTWTHWARCHSDFTHTPPPLPEPALPLQLCQQPPLLPGDHPAGHHGGGVPGAGRAGP